MGFARDDADHEHRSARHRIHRDRRRRAHLQRPRRSDGRHRCGDLARGDPSPVNTSAPNTLRSRSACSSCSSSRRRLPRTRRRWTSCATGLFGSQPLGNQAYLLLIAGNIGAVIMPWMIFYQQSVDRRQRLESRKPHLRANRYGDRLRRNADHHDRDRRHDRRDVVRPSHLRERCGACGPGARPADGEVCRRSRSAPA